MLLSARMRATAADSTVETADACVCHAGASPHRSGATSDREPSLWLNHVFSIYDQVTYRWLLSSGRV